MCKSDKPELCDPDRAENMLLISIMSHQELSSFTWHNDYASLLPSCLGGCASEPFLTASSSGFLSLCQGNVIRNKVQV